MHEYSSVGNGVDGVLIRSLFFRVWFGSLCMRDAIPSWALYTILWRTFSKVVVTHLKLR